MTPFASNHRYLDINPQMSTSVCPRKSPITLECRLTIPEKTPIRTHILRGLVIEIIKFRGTLEFGVTVTIDAYGRRFHSRADLSSPDSRQFNQTH